MRIINLLISLYFIFPRASLRVSAPNIRYLFLVATTSFSVWRLSRSRKRLPPLTGNLWSRQSQRVWLQHHTFLAVSMQIPRIASFCLSLSLMSLQLICFPKARHILQNVSYNLFSSFSIFVTGVWCRQHHPTYAGSGRRRLLSLCLLQKWFLLALRLSLFVF